jgi:phosphoribosylamine--glycine ligase
MRILFISNDLIAGNVAYLLRKEGHNVKLYIQEEGRKNNLDNLVKKTPDWKLELGWVGKKGLIVFDDIGYGLYQDSLRKEGYSVFGGSQKGDLLEQDRVMAQNIFSKYNIKTLPIYNFHKINQAIAFIRKNRDVWVVKQNGSASKGVNYVGHFDDSRDVIDILKTYKKNNSHNSEAITLQKKVVGIEIAATRYFNGTDWIGPTLINIEHKKFFPGDIGPTTSEMGTLGWYDPDDNNRLFKDTLSKLEPHLKSINYRGIIDINCIVNERGTFPLEATSRIGSPIVHLQSTLNNSPWSKILSAVAGGKKIDLDYKKEIGVVVVIAIPPFPYSKKIEEHSQINTPIYFHDSITPEQMSNIHFEEISYDKITKQYYVSDDRGYIVYVTGTGSTPEKARKMAYEIIDMIHIPKMLYRNDIGLKFINESQSRLREWGYIK